MNKKINCLLLLSALAVSLLSGCSSPAASSQIPEASGSSAVVDDSIAIASSSDNARSDKESVNSVNSQPQNESLVKEYILYRADFDIPDCRNLGYTNLIDFYNDYPNGKSGGTFANAGLMVHYPGDLDSDLSDSDSLAFLTYRGIGLGSSLDEVFDAYGPVTVSPPNDWELGISTAEHTLKQTVMYSGQINSGAYVTLRFYFDQNDTVMFISYDAIYAQYSSDVNNADTYRIAIN